MHRRRSLLFCVLTSALLAALSLLPLGPFEGFELKTLDLRFRLRERWRAEAGPRRVDTVLLDDASLASFAHWPLPYEPYADAIAALAGAGTRAIGLDLVLAPADSTRPREERDYHRLVNEVAKAPGTVVAAAPPATDGTAGHGKRLELSPVPETQAYPWNCADPGQSRELRIEARELPGLDLARAARRIGQAGLERDDDGVIRRIPLCAQIGSGCYPSFALQVVCESMGIPPSGVHLGARHVELWRGATRAMRIPVDNRGRMLVDYQQRSQRDHGDLSLAALAAGRVDPSTLRDRVVLLGASARPFGQFHSTPLVSQMADVAIHAEAIETILSGRFLIPARRLVQFLITWAFLLCAALLMVRTSPWRGVLIGLAMMAAYVVLEKAAFIWGGFWLDFMAPMVVLQAAMVGYPLWSWRVRSQGLLEEMSRLRHFDDLVLSTMTSGLLVADDEGRIIMSNARAARLLGRHEGDLDGRTLQEVFAHSETALGALERAMAPSDPPALGPACSLPLHVPVIREAGGDEGDRILDLSVSSLDAAVRGRSGRHGRRYLLTFNDITERLRVAQEDERRARLAAIGEIAAKLGHEIRNSLGGLRLYVENVREEIDPKGAAGRAIDSMVEEIESLYRKIDELREYARDPHLEVSECDVKQLVDEALAFSGQKLRDKHIQVFIEAQPHLAPLQADRRQIRDAFQNLINNAIEAAPIGGRLHIGIERATGGNGSGHTSGNYLVHFDDDGPGIPSEVGDQVFSLFFTTKTEAGTGLGLSIVKKIVESHGGRVSYQSDPGQGTRFTVQLPPSRRGEGTS